ncbi:hypothetical protein ASPCAL01623 [Aspergillus calidoustus]|uniref:Uncharacterized protein n=1 Tax=Aspergillus calidoustus TaxID=454130 RepID=A0A0U5FRC6_ASPCI|nr:hypothetical protein ASPCAL01623 [Aspergillus calidoustus]
MVSFQTPPTPLHPSPFQSGAMVYRRPSLCRRLTPYPDPHPDTDTGTGYMPIPEGYVLVDGDGQTVALGLTPRPRKRDCVRQILTKARARARSVVRYSGKVIKFAGRAGLVICEIVKETGVVVWAVLVVVAEGM